MTTRALEDQEIKAIFEHIEGVHEKRNETLLIVGIGEAIRTIINQFHRKPHNFFNEHDFHNYCYHVLYSMKEFSRQYATSDDKKTNILHPEYPTLKKFRRKDICLDPNGTRAKYDMVILNPEFIKKNTFKKVRGRDISLFGEKDFTTPNLIAAIEFKFITQHSQKFKQEIDYDFFKLSMADEVMYKYMLVFANTKKQEIAYFREIDSVSGIKIAYVCVDNEGDKKKIEVTQIPDDEQNELKLSMTPEEVKEILGEPDDVEEDRWGATIFYYKEHNKERRIRFVNGLVVHIFRLGEPKR